MRADRFALVGLSFPLEYLAAHTSAHTAVHTPFRRNLFDKGFSEAALEVYEHIPTQ